MKINYLHKKQIALTTRQKDFLTSCQHYISALKTSSESDKTEFLAATRINLTSNYLDHTLRSYFKQNKVVLTLLNMILSKEMEEDPTLLSNESYLFHIILENHGAFSDTRFIEDILDLTNRYFKTAECSTKSPEEIQEKQKLILEVIESKIKVKASEDGFQEWFLSLYTKHAALLSKSPQLSRLATDFESAKSLEGLPATTITEEVDLSHERSTCATLFNDLKQVLLDNNHPCSDHFFNNVCIANFTKSFSELTQENLEQLATILTALKSALNRKKIQSPTGDNKHTLIKEGLKHRGLLTKEGCVFYIDTISTLHESGEYTDDLEKQFTQGTNNEHWNKVHNSEISCQIVPAKPEAAEAGAGEGAVPKAERGRAVIHDADTGAEAGGGAAAPEAERGRAVIHDADTGAEAGGAAAPETERAVTAPKVEGAGAERGIGSTPQSIQELINSTSDCQNPTQSATVYIIFLERYKEKLALITDKDLSEYAAGKERCPKLPNPPSERKWKTGTGDMRKANKLKNSTPNDLKRKNETLTTIWKLQAGKLESFTKETLEKEVVKYADVLTKEQKTAINAKIKELKAEAEAKEVAVAAAKKAAEAEEKKAAKKEAAEAAAKKAAEAAAKKAAEARKVAKVQQRRYLSTAFKAAGAVLGLGLLAYSFQEDGDGEVGALALGFTQLFSTLGLASWGIGSEYSRNHESATPFNANKYGNTMLMHAALNGDERTINLLLEQGVNIDDINLIEQTALFSAIIGRNINSVMSLLKAGANVNHPDHKQATPLHFASQNGHLDSVNALLKFGAEVDKADEYKYNPLHFASQNGHLNSVKALLDAGASMDKADIKGATPLHLASQNGHLDSVNALLKFSAEVDKTDKDGATPLHLASQDGRLSCINALLKFGAEVDKTEKHGISPLYIAAQNGHLDCVEALLTAGADIAAKTKGPGGVTAVEIAREEGHHECVQLLEAARTKK